jgi:hypothetical protein
MVAACAIRSSELLAGELSDVVSPLMAEERAASAQTRPGRVEHAVRGRRRYAVAHYARGALAFAVSAAVCPTWRLKSQ